MGPYANVDPRGLTLAQLNERKSWLANVVRDMSAPGDQRSSARAGIAQMDQLIASFSERQAAVQAQQQQQQRQGLVTQLQDIAKGGGTAYSTTMGQVNKGNARIGALAASGRGGLNAGVNAANAKALSTSAGNMQGMAAREAEKAGARNALGQVIAQGQDANNAQIQQQIADLQTAYGQASTPNPYMTAASQLGGLAMAGYQAYGNQPPQDPNAQNKARGR